MIVVITDSSQVGDARRRAGAFALGAGLAEPRAASFSLVATELATNLLKHGSGGQIVMQQFDDAEGSGIECLALDRGAGMADVARCLTDGYSTAGSAGTGLGAVSRQADRFDVFSRPGIGTAILARFITGPASATGPDSVTGLRLGAAVVAHPGETVCGDAWSVGLVQGAPALMVVDGSGHGPEARHAAVLACEVFQSNLADDCARIIERIHRALMPTRGAAVALARVDVAAGKIRYIGVGNICGQLLSADGSRHMVSHNGTAGHIAPRIQAFEYGFTGEPLVIMHSDGVSGRWSLVDYPGLAARHPALVAGVILRDHRRGRDDATVVALRLPA